MGSAGRTTLHDPAQRDRGPQDDRRRGPGRALPIDRRVWWLVAGLWIAAFLARGRHGPGRVVLAAAVSIAAAAAHLHPGLARLADAESITAGRDLRAPGDQPLARRGGAPAVRARPRASGAGLRAEGRGARAGVPASAVL